MKASINLLGTGRGLDSPILTIKPSMAMWMRRYMQVYGPVPEPLKQFADGVKSGPPAIWLSMLADDPNAHKALVCEDSAWLPPPARLGWDSAVMPRATGEALARCAAIAERDSPRAYGTVVNFETGDFCGTDGFRLYQQGGFPMMPRGFSMPRDAAKFLGKALKDVKESSWMVSQDGCILCVAWGEWQVYVKLSAVKFPAYRAVIPKADKLYAHIPLDAAHECRSKAQRLCDAVKNGAKGLKSEPTTLDTAAGPVLLNARFFLDATSLKPDWYAHVSDREAPVLGKVGEHGRYVIVPIAPAKEERKRA